MSQNTWATKEVSTQLNVEDKGGREHILLPYKEYSAECKKNILQCKICVYLERKPSNSNEGGGKWLIFLLLWVLSFFDRLGSD